MYPGPGEPIADLRPADGIDALARNLLGTASAARPRIIAVDGRGGSGKSTLADRPRDAIPGAQVVHSDDIACWHSRFGWEDVMIDGVLAPLHAGRDVRYQPPAWASRGRTGWVEVSSSAPAVIVEGCGASRRELAHLIDATVWAQFDFDEAKRRALPIIVALAATGTVQNRPDRRRLGRGAPSREREDDRGMTGSQWFLIR